MHRWWKVRCHNRRRRKQGVVWRPHHSSEFFLLVEGWSGWMVVLSFLRIERRVRSWSRSSCGDYVTVWRVVGAPSFFL